MKNISYKILIIISIFGVQSCGFIKDFKKDYERPKVRFVDLQGRPHNIELKTPRDNFQALQSQGNLTNHKIESAPQATYSKKIQAQNKYAQNQQSELGKTIALPVDNSQQIAKNESQKLAASQQKIQEIEYDLGEEEVAQQPKPEPVKIIPTPKKPKKIQTKNQKLKKGLYVQVGSFRSLNHSKTQIAKVKKLTKKSTKFSIQNAKVGKKNYHRVLIGPFNSRKAAKLEIANLKKKGQKSILIKIK